MSILKQLEEPNFKATKSDKVLIKYIKENPAFQRKEMRDYLLTDGGYHVII